MTIERFQRNAVARALLDQVGMGHVWGGEGPTQAAYDLRARAFQLPVREGLFLRMAFGLLHLDEGPTWGELVRLLPRSDLSFLVGVLIALSEEPGALAAARLKLMEQE